VVSVVVAGSVVSSAAMVSGEGGECAGAGQALGKVREGEGYGMIDFFLSRSPRSPAGQEEDGIGHGTVGAWDLARVSASGVVEREWKGRTQE
jgi:hypothetical protein